MPLEVGQYESPALSQLFRGLLVALHVSFLPLQVRNLLVQQAGRWASIVIATSVNLFAWTSGFGGSHWFFRAHIPNCLDMQLHLANCLGRAPETLYWRGSQKDTLVILSYFLNLRNTGSDLAGQPG